jgi:hypothetical protein
MRLHNLFIAVLILGLFSVVLYGEGLSFLENTDDSQNYTSNTSGKAESLFSTLDILDSTDESLAEMDDKAPGGIDSTIPGEEDTTEGAMQRSGLSYVAKAGTFLFSVPRVLIEAIATFLDINSAFVTVATAAFMLIVSIILVSSILRNRL